MALQAPHDGRAASNHRRSASPISKQTSHAANAMLQAAWPERRRALFRPRRFGVRWAIDANKEGIEMNSALLIGLVWFLVFAAATGAAAALGHNLNAWYIGWLAIDAMSALLVAGSVRLAKS
jgi:hypothetical protein